MFTTSTDIIMAVFHKTIKRLEKHIGDQLQRADEHDKQTRFHASWVEYHNREITKARTAVEKIRALVN